MVKIESKKIYNSFVLLFTLLFVSSILMITPASVLKYAQATSGGEDEGDDGHEDMGGDSKGDGGHEDMGGETGVGGHGGGSGGDVETGVGGHGGGSGGGNIPDIGEPQFFFEDGPQIANPDFVEDGLGSGGGNIPDLGESTDFETGERDEK